MDSTIIGWAGLVELSPDGVMDFGGVGLWIMALSIAGMTNGLSKKWDIWVWMQGSASF
ncbi:hypothetical protein [Pseudoneobacillus sp. C159]